MRSMLNALNSAIAKAVRRHDMKVDKPEDAGNCLFLSNDFCLLIVQCESESVYSVCASLASNKEIKSRFGVDPYRFYLKMSEKMPFFSIKMEDEEIVYTVYNDMQSEIGADIDECVLVSKMFNATFEQVIAETGGRMS